MGKRKNRQADVNDDVSLHSSESGEDTNSGGSKCPHILKGIYFTGLRKILKKVGIKTDCAACSKDDSNKIQVDDEDGMTPLIQPLWLCLRCGNQACGRAVNQHAEQHFKTPHSESHCLAVDTHQWSIWCYECENVVNADSRKQLLEIIEFIKKLATTAYTPSQPAIPLPGIDKQTENINIAKDKQKVLPNLTRVGGLMNLGNTCFFNSVLQCLAQTPFLVKVLDDLREQGAKFVLPGGKFKASDDSEELELPPIEGVLEGWGNFTETLWKTLRDMQSSDGNQTYKPSELLNAFKKKQSQCMDGGQHDSHELLRHLLELVRNDDLRRYQSIILKAVGLDDKAKRQSVDDTLKAQVKFYGNQASARHLGPEPVFRGVLVSTLECLECHHSSQRTEPFLDLSLPVLMDKPQPPMVKRRNSGHEDNFDLMGNNISSAPSKYQLKKEKKAARKIRKMRRQHNANVNESLPNENNISEENQESLAESEESDADVEDNIEGDGTPQEVIESGYSSEKVSTVASPVSPGEPEIGVATNGNILPSPMETSESTRLKTDQSSLELMLDVTQTPFTSSSAASPATEAVNDAEASSELSPSTSLIIDRGVSPAAIVSPLSSPITSKESPTSPTSSPQERLWKIAVNDDDKCNNRGNKQKTFSEAETDECRSETENSTRKIIKNLPNKQNGINEITAGLSKLTTSTHQSPTRYHIKDGDCSIQSCLNQFTALELMSGSNKVGCEACTTRENKGKDGKMVCTPSTKQYLISRVPAVLILHLKRFQSQRFGFRKVSKHVAFPMVLDLAPVCKYHSKPKMYSLYGVVEHSGTLHGGHYVAYVKARQPLDANDPRWSFLPKAGASDGEEINEANADAEVNEEGSVLKAEPPPGRWYYVSDSRVMEIDEASVLQREAYLLFYERIL